MVSDIQPFILQRVSSLYTLGLVSLLDSHPATLSLPNRDFFQAAPPAPPSLILLSPFQLLPLFLNCLLTLFTHSLGRPLLRPAACQTLGLSWDPKDELEVVPVSGGQTKSLQRTAVALGWVPPQSRVQGSQRSLDSFSSAQDSSDMPQEGTEFRKPGLSLSNWLHHLPSLGRGSEWGRRAQAGEVPAEQSWASTFPLKVTQALRVILS